MVDLELAQKDFILFTQWIYNSMRIRQMAHILLVLFLNAFYFT